VQRVGAQVMLPSWFVAGSRRSCKRSGLRFRSGWLGCPTPSIQRFRLRLALERSGKVEDRTSCIEVATKSYSFHSRVGRSVLSVDEIAIKKL
jgi:hypothetical protein